MAVIVSPVNACSSKTVFNLAVFEKYTSVIELDGSGRGGGEGNGDVPKHGGCCGRVVTVICFFWSVLVDLRFYL